MNLQTLRDFIATNLTPQMIAHNVSSILIEVAEGKHPLNERLGAGYTVRDVRACKGFWLVPALVDDMIAIFIGSWAKGAAKQLNVDLSKATMPELIELMHETDDVQKEAHMPTMIIVLGKLGSIELNLTELDTLHSKLAGSQAYADKTVLGSTHH